MKNRVAYLLWKYTTSLCTGCQVKTPSLALGQWQSFTFTEMNSQELDNVWVSHCAKDITFFFKVLNSVAGLSMLKKNFMDLLTSVSEA